MADLTITAANVAYGSDAVIVHGTAGASLTAGQPLYKDTANANVMKLADANASALTATVAGVALHAAASGQPIAYQTGGAITIGATVTSGVVYVASATAGGIAPAADLTTGWRTSIIGVATSASVIQLSINNSGAVV